MKRCGLIILVLVFGIYMAGCNKKQAGLDETQGTAATAGAATMASMDNLAAMSTSAQPNNVVTANVSPDVSVPTATDADSGESSLAPLPPAGPYRPTVQEIQTALKNSGFYSGAVDGKAGPLTKKATEEFQKVNSIQVDGKVGPKTWGLLEKYLEAAPVVASLEVTKAKKR